MDQSGCASEDANNRKGFLIPKVKSSPGQGCRRIESQGSRLWLDIFSLLNCPSLYKQFNWSETWCLETISAVVNEKFQEGFLAKKRELKKKYSSVPKESFAFGLTESEEEAERICSDGDFSCQSVNVPLGNIDQGVTVCLYPEVLLSWAEKKGIQHPYLIIYRIIKGRSNSTPARTSTKEPILDPSPNAESHVSFGVPSESEPLFRQLSKSQIFLFEYDDEALPSKHPRHCLPHAVISLTSRKCAAGLSPYEPTISSAKAATATPGASSDKQTTTSTIQDSSVPNRNKRNATSNSLPHTTSPWKSAVCPQSQSTKWAKNLSPEKVEVEACAKKNKDKNNLNSSIKKKSQNLSQGVGSSKVVHRMKLSDRFANIPVTPPRLKIDDKKLEELIQETLKAKEKLQALRVLRLNNAMQGFCSSGDESSTLQNASRDTSRIETHSESICCDEKPEVSPNTKSTLAGLKITIPNSRHSSVSSSTADVDDCKEQDKDRTDLFCGGFQSKTRDDSLKTSPTLRIPCPPEENEQFREKHRAGTCRSRKKINKFHHRHSNYSKSEISCRRYRYKAEPRSRTFRGSGRGKIRFHCPDYFKSDDESHAIDEERDAYENAASPTSSSRRKQCNTASVSLSQTEMNCVERYDGNGVASADFQRLECHSSKNKYYNQVICSRDIDPIRTGVDHQLTSKEPAINDLVQYRSLLMFEDVSSDDEPNPKSSAADQQSLDVDNIEVQDMDIEVESPADSWQNKSWPEISNQGLPEFIQSVYQTVNTEQSGCTTVPAQNLQDCNVQFGVSNHAHQFTGTLPDERTHSSVSADDLFHGPETSIDNISKVARPDPSAVLLSEANVPAFKSVYQSVNTEHISGAWTMPAQHLYNSNVPYCVSNSAHPFIGAVSDGFSSFATADLHHGAETSMQNTCTSTFAGQDPSAARFCGTWNPDPGPSVVEILKQLIDKAPTDEYKTRFTMALQAWLNQDRKRETIYLNEQYEEGPSGTPVEDAPATFMNNKAVIAGLAECLNHDNTNEQSPVEISDNYKVSSSVNGENIDPELLQNTNSKQELQFHGRPLITQNKGKPVEILLDNIHGENQPVDPRAALSALFERKFEIDLKAVLFSKDSHSISAESNKDPRLAKNKIPRNETSSTQSSSCVPAALSPIFSKSTRASAQTTTACSTGDYTRTASCTSTKSISDNEHNTSASSTQTTIGISTRYSTQTTAANSSGTQCAHTESSIDSQNQTSQLLKKLAHVSALDSIATCPVPSRRITPQISHPMDLTSCSAKHLTHVDRRNQQKGLKFSSQQAVVTEGIDKEKGSVHNMNFSTHPTETDSDRMRSRRYSNDSSCSGRSSVSLSSVGSQGGPHYRSRSPYRSKSPQRNKLPRPRRSDRQRESSHCHRSRSPESRSRSSSRDGFQNCRLTLEENKCDESREKRLRARTSNDDSSSCRRQDSEQPTTRESECLQRTSTSHFENQDDRNIEHTSHNIAQEYPKFPEQTPDTRRVFMRSLKHEMYHRDVHVEQPLFGTPSPSPQNSDFMPRHI